MCHAFLTDTNFYQLLFRIDESIAEEVSARGCDCGGVLHSARYPRKPRGIRCALDCNYESRLSFCCSQDGCRRRHTPASVRFLGRKVYLGVIVVLITALHHGLTDQRRRRLIEELDVPAQTLWRWRRWWRAQFLQSRCWRGLAGRFVPADCHRQPTGISPRTAVRKNAFRAARAAADFDFPSDDIGKLCEGGPPPAEDVIAPA